MGLISSRRPRPLSRSNERHLDARLVVIATEGEKTEKQYFMMFGNKRVQVEVLETKDGKSAPKFVLERLREYRREYVLNKDDLLFLVVDKDRWQSQQLGFVASESIKLKADLIVSNPGFELWLLLHHVHPDHVKHLKNSQEVEDELRKILGEYNKSNIKTEHFESNVGKAVERAISMDVKPKNRWPNQIGTRVYRVVQAIKSIMENHNG